MLDLLFTAMEVDADLNEADEDAGDDEDESVYELHIVVVEHLQRCEHIKVLSSHHTREFTNKSIHVVDKQGVNKQKHKCVKKAHVCLKKHTCAFSKKCV